MIYVLRFLLVAVYTVVCGGGACLASPFDREGRALVIVVSDNGASGEGGPDGSVNEMKFANGIPDDLAQNLAMIDDLGSPKTYNHYTTGWAMAFNTPFKMWKRYEFNGGTCDPCIIAWPSVLGHGGEIREQYHHAIDIVPTILDCLGVVAPDSIKGHTQAALDGVSMRYSFEDASVPTARPTQFYSMLGSRAIWHDGWKAVTTHPTISGWGHFNDDEWELYHTDTDRAEVHDRAAEHPDKVRELSDAWEQSAAANLVFPLDDGTGLLQVLRRPEDAELHEEVRLLAGTPTLERYRSQKLIALRDFTIVIDTDHGIGDAGVLANLKNLFPGFTSIGRFVQSSITTRPPQWSLRRHVNDVRVLRVDGDFPDVF